jgi:hypothetical protein
MDQTNGSKGESQIAPEDGEPVAFFMEHFDPAYYLETYSDVAAAGHDPLQHWLSYGFAEGRQISRFVELRYGRIARRSSSRIWRHYRWRGEEIAVRTIEPVQPGVISQIVDQARHDPAVLAAGAEAIDRLIQVDRENIHVDIAGLQRAIAHDVECLLIVSKLVKSESSECAAGIVAAPDDSGLRSIQTIVVEQESAGDAVTPNVLFWPDIWLSGNDAVKLSQFAQLISLLRPRVTIVADCRFGYEVVARFGRALSARTKIYCVYSAGAGDDLATNFTRLTAPFATTLTDNPALAAITNPGQDNCGVVLLPSARAEPDRFRAAVAALLVPT